MQPLKKKIIGLKAKPWAYVQYLMNLDLTKDELSSEIERYIEYQEKWLHDVVNQVKGQLNAEKKMNKKKRVKTATSVQWKSELEHIFF